MATDRHYLETVLRHYDPTLVVIEACALAGWVHDVCTSKGYQVLVCNPAQEPWKWKHLKRKTDRDDALKIAKLAALDQLVPVYIPGREQREFRSLVNYRKVVLGRRNRVQNHHPRHLRSARDGHDTRPEGLDSGQARGVNPVRASRWPTARGTNCGAGNWI